MHMNTIILKKLFFLFVVQFLSLQAFADQGCTTACELEHSNCQKVATSQEQKNRCNEQSSICSLNCNRDKTMYCTYLGFKDHDGVADKEKELQEVTGGFARVTSDGRTHLGALCLSNNMKCDHVLSWENTLHYCGGEVRNPRRVACCR